MNFILELLVEVFGWFFPGTRPHAERSIVGESKMDRSAKFWAGAGLVVIVLIGIGAWAWARYL